MSSAFEEFGAVFETVPAAILLVDDSGQIVLANSDVSVLFEYETGELVGKPIEVLVPKDVRSGHPELRTAYQVLPHRRTMGSGRDLHGVTKSGRLIPVEIGLSTVEIDNRRYSVASVVDVSAMIAQQQRTRSAIDATGTAMLMVAPDGKIVLSNAAAEDMFGASHGGLLDTSIDNLVPERFRRHHAVYRASFTATPVVRKMGVGRELFGLRRDGSEFPIEIGLTPINEHGKTMVMVTVIDISARVKTEQDMREKNTVLARLNDDLTQFAYSASHDLKAPLTTIQGLLGCVIEDINGENYAEALLNANRTKDLTHRLAQLIESTLGLAQSESYEDADFEPINLSSLVDDVETSLQATFDALGVELRRNFAPGCAPVSQTVRIRHILENLVSNGAKYADRQEDQPFVEVSASIDAGTFTLTVRDNGVGIPEDSHQHVFKRFRRFGRHDVEGSGVGLALVKQHVERLDGNIRFSSSPQGTTFVVDIPQPNAQTAPT